LGYGLEWAQGAFITWGPDRPAEDMPGQKWLNQSICRLGCGLGWAEGTMY